MGSELGGSGGAILGVGDGDVQSNLRSKEVFHLLRVHPVDVSSDSPSLWRQSSQVVDVAAMKVHIQ